MVSEPLTVDVVKARVDVIAQIAEHDEDAHGTEDDLWLEVLTAIANGAENPKELAQEAIKTQDIKFARWCA